MRQSTYLIITSILFLVIALFHAFRLFYGWEAVIGGVRVPLSFSWFAVFIAGILASVGSRLGRK